MITALGGGIVRDVLLDSLPPATFSDWRYLATAAGGGLIAFVAGRRLERLNTPITVLDAAGLSLFAVTGAGKRSEEHTSELQSRENLVCRLLLGKKNRPP